MNPALFFENIKVVLDDGGGTEAATPEDITDRGSVVVLPEEFSDERVNTFPRFAKARLSQCSPK